MIGQIKIADVVQDPSRIVAESIVVTHGRQRVTDGASPSTIDLVMLVPAPGLPSWTLGNTLTVRHDTGPLFAGRISDINMTHVDTVELGRCARLRVTAVGPVGALGARVVGDEPWPQETGAQRAARIMNLAHVAYGLDGDIDHLVVARDVDAQPALGLLEELAESTGAAIYDAPTGVVMYQALSGRARPILPYAWQDFPATDLWADFDATATWADFAGDVSPGSELPVELPPGVVEWEPAWNLTEAEVVNHVRVGYGTPPEGEEQAYAEASDTVSQTAHGRRYTYIGTQLAEAASANARAGHIITTQARPRWSIPDAVVLLDVFRDTDPGLYLGVMGLLCGDHVVLHGMPQPAPALDWPAICEGWTYQYWKTAGTEHERMTLALSDPLASLAVMRWDEYPPLYVWSEHPTYLTWSDVTTPTVLEATG